MRAASTLLTVTTFSVVLVVTIPSFVPTVIGDPTSTGRSHSNGRIRCFLIPVHVLQQQHHQQKSNRPHYLNYAVGTRPRRPSPPSKALSAGIFVEAVGFGAVADGDDRENTVGRLQQQQQQQQQQQHQEHPGTSSRKRPRGRKRPLVDPKQLSPQEVRLRWPDTEFEVPRDMPAAVATFFEQPTPKIVILGILAVVATRLCCDAEFSFADTVAVPIVALGWSFQEWAIHKYLLHGVEGWMGHEIHEGHHEKPYYHVCIDPPDLVASWTIAAACIFRLLLPPPLALTVLATYMIMGLVYEWTHYIVHTGVVPRSRSGKELKRHHTRHHLKDESCWLAFTVPLVDTLLGTVPACKNNGQLPEARTESTDTFGDGLERR